MKEGKAARRRGEGGWSLVELAITIVIAGLVLTFAVPNFIKQVVHYRFVGYSEELRSMLETAHQKALRTGFQHRVTINMDWGDAMLEEGDAGSGSTTWTVQWTHTPPIDGTPVITIVNQGDTCADAPLPNPVSVVFNPNHTADGRVICLTSPTGELREIRVQAGTSRVELTRGT